MAYRVIGNSKLLTPGEEPFEASELIAHMRVAAETTENDDIAAKLKAARQLFEKETNRAIALQVYKLTMPCFPVYEPILLPYGSLSSVQTIKYYDADGELQTLRDLVDASPAIEGDVLINPDAELAEIHLAPEATWPVTQIRFDAVQITFEAGYATIPPDLKLGIMQLAAHWYENREVFVDGQIANVPFGVQQIIDDNKIHLF